MERIRIKPRSHPDELGELFECVDWSEPQVTRVPGPRRRSVYSGDVQTTREHRTRGHVDLVNVREPNSLRYWAEEMTRLDVTNEDGTEVLVSNVWLNGNTITHGPGSTSERWGLEMG